MNSKAFWEKKEESTYGLLFIQRTTLSARNLLTIRQQHNTTAMRAVLQRVSEASVTINGVVKSQIRKGLLILLGIEQADSQKDVDWLVKKVLSLRIFDDEKGVMNRSITDIGGDIIVVSQFTLMASYKKGNRPSYIKAARHDVSVPLYEMFCATLQQNFGKEIGTGEFGADMKVRLLNDGPVTICMDTHNKE